PLRDVAAHFDSQGTRLNEKDLLALADAPEPRAGGNRGNFRPGNAAAAFQLANAKMRMFDQEGAALLVDPGRGDGGTIFVQSASVVPAAPVTPAPTGPTPAAPAPTGNRVYDKTAKVIPQMVLAIEHYNRIVRMVQAG